MKHMHLLLGTYVKLYMTEKMKHYSKHGDQ